MMWQSSTQQGFNDLEDSWVADGALDEAAPVEHFVAKWGRLLGEISSFIPGGNSSKIRSTRGN